MVVALLRSLLPAASAVAIGALVSRSPAAVQAGVDSEPFRALLRMALVVVGLFAAERVLPVAHQLLQARVVRDIDWSLRERVLRAVEDSPEAGPLTDPMFQNRLAAINGGFFGTTGAAVAATVGVLGRYIQAISCAAIIAVFSIPLALLGFTIIVVIRRRWHVVFADLAMSMVMTSAQLRRSSYFADLVLQPAAAKEVRIFGLLDWAIERHRHFWDQGVASAFALRRRLRSRVDVELLALIVSALLTAVLSARAATRGEIGFGLLAAILQAQVLSGQLIAPTTDDYVTDSALVAIDALRAIEGAAEGGSGARHAVPASAPAEEIRFRGVSFTYPGVEQPTLDSFDLAIAAGESVAIVGANGAGKTTLIKLLSLLHRPTVGAITVDGTDLAEVDPVSWRRQLAVIFQDFNRYEATAHDNVVFGAPNLPADSIARDVAAEAAGATAVVESLPSGWDTLLSRQYEGGTDLSGGQWQRIAIARALYAVQRGARVLVLDEPTANLDVRSETRMFERVLEATTGVTTILISHRFSSVRRADRIVVLDGGRIVESGRHEELLAAGGLYAEMFHTQADRFVDKDDVVAREAADA